MAHPGGVCGRAAALTWLLWMGHPAGRGFFDTRPMSRARDDALLDLIEAAGKVHRSNGLPRLGLTRSSYHRLLKAGELLRLSGSAFVTARQWAAADRWQQFRLRSVAVGLSAPATVHLTG